MPKSEFAKNVLTLMTGTGIAQVIPLAISPILSRLYSPEDFGLFALYMSLATIISLISTGRYEQAIVLPKHRTDALHIAILSGVLCLTVSVITLVVVWLFNDQICNLLNNQDIQYWLYLIPVSIFFSGTYQVVNYLNIREKHFKTISTGKIFQTLVGSSSNLTMGFSGAYGLIPASVLGLFTAVIVQGKKMYKILIREPYKILKIKEVAKRYNKFPIFDVPSAILNSLNTSFFVILITNFYGLYLIGFYSFANRILFTPSSLLTGSISNVVFQRISENYAKGQFDKIQDDLYKIVRKIFLGITIPFFLFIFLSKYYIPFLFGEKWSELYKYLYIISMLVYTIMMVSPMAYLLKIYNLQNISLLQHLKVVIGRFLVLGICVYSNESFLVTLFYTILIHVFFLYLNILQVFKKTKLAIIKNYHYMMLIIVIVSLYIYKVL